MNRQAIRYPFPWRTTGTIAAAGSLAAILVFAYVLWPVMSFHWFTDNTAGRTNKDPKMQSVEDRAFLACARLQENACYEAAGELDRGSVQDLKYRLVVAKSNNVINPISDSPTDYVAPSI
ncbi:MAG TPA: hypothetical protein VFW40_10300, partial [Capsulimonadaceae bacterium]|nr:hypothetical protein [Capsulimonadaceae bacterium]